MTDFVNGYFPLLAGSVLFIVGVSLLLAIYGDFSEWLASKRRHDQALALALRQRDELLSALKGVLPFLTGNYWPGVEADAAVDRAITIAREAEGLPADTKGHNDRNDAPAAGKASRHD